jgi:hypothetical protein
MNMPAAKKYTSDIVDFRKIKMTDPVDPTKSVDAWEAVVNFPDARRVWLSIATPKVLAVKAGDDFPKTTAQITLKDNSTGKSLIIVGSLSIPGGSFLQLFGGSLVNNKTITVRASDECSLYYESKLDD